MDYKDWSITANNMKYSGKRWGERGGVPVIALHGWLDNCASFDLVAPQLKGVDLYCIDVAGHGKTDARPGGGPYTLMDDVRDVFFLADAMGFAQFGLLGHSRGAMISAVAAGTFPDRILSVGLIEGIFPPVVKDSEVPNQLRQSILDKAVYQSRNRSVYPSYSKAVIARENGLFSLSTVDANILADWGVESVEGGCSWRYDTEVMMASSMRLTEAQVLAFIQRITAPVRLILSDGNCVYSGNAEVLEKIDALNLPTSFLAGGHHLHMSEQSKAVAEFLNPLYQPEP